MEVYRDLGLHSMFASSLVLEHTVGDERFSTDELFRAGKHYPRPMRYRFFFFLVSPPMLAAAAAASVAGALPVGFSLVFGVHFPR